eukprot:COSAG06_NODE_14021_length_1197_cov_1.439891_2_plen_32_part_01
MHDDSRVTQDKALDTEEDFDESRANLIHTRTF